MGTQSVEKVQLMLGFFDALAVLSGIQPEKGKCCSGEKKFFDFLISRSGKIYQTYTPDKGSEYGAPSGFAHTKIDWPPPSVKTGDGGLPDYHLYFCSGTTEMA